MYGKCNESVWTWHTGVGGNVLVNEKAARVGSYNVWDYAEGQDSYQSLMLVDLTRPPEEVNKLFCIIIIPNHVQLALHNATIMCVT